MEQFELIEDFEACFHALESGMFDNTIEEELAISYDRCPTCDVPMAVKATNQYVCIHCGLLKEDVEVLDMSTIASDMSYNSMSNGLRCVGSNSYRYQTILRSQSSNDASPEIHIRNILFTYNHVIGKKGAIPKDILLNVCEQYKHVRTEGTIFRGTILRAILAAMVYYECLRNRLWFKPSDIYRWFEVDSQTYSKGDKKVREMLDHGFLPEDIRETNALLSYIYASAIQLELPEEQITFLMELMDFVTEHKLLNPNAKYTTRSLCVIHMFLVSINHPMKPEEFRVLFNCNYGTIRTIALDLFHASSTLYPLFAKHSIACNGLNTYSEKSQRVVRKRRAKHGRIELK